MHAHMHAHTYAHIHTHAHRHFFVRIYSPKEEGHSDVVIHSVAQSVTCLATDASLTADPGVASLPVPYFRGD